MSAYFNLPVEVSTVVRTRCDTATFEWLAEVFSCSECGGNDFAPAEDKEANLNITMEDSSDAADIETDPADDEQAGSDTSIEDSPVAADVANENKKGKRPMSDTGSPLTGDSLYL